MKLAQGRDRVDNWEPQFRIHLTVNGFKICDYICDFLVRYVDGRVELCEVKGFVTPEFRIKEKLFRATFLQDHPNIIYTIRK